MSALDGKTKIKPRIWYHEGQWVCGSNASFRLGWGKTPEEAYFSWKAS